MTAQRRQCVDNGGNADLGGGRRVFGDDEPDEESQQLVSARHWSRALNSLARKTHRQSTGFYLIAGRYAEAPDECRVDVDPVSP